MAATVVELWRYPVKSLTGEACDELTLDERGVIGDRLWALVDPDGGIASGKTTRRFRKVLGLMAHRAVLNGGRPTVILADGRKADAGTAEADALVAEIAGPGWRLAREAAVPHFDDAGLHLVSTATLRAIGSALGAVGSALGAEVPSVRLRPNVVLDVAADGFPEDGWVGRTARLGTARVRVTGPTERCVMVNHPRAGVPERDDVLKTIGRVNAVNAGVYAEVVTPGTIRLGDVLELPA